jgi:hypothetical protein
LFQQATYSQPMKHAAEILKGEGYTPAVDNSTDGGDGNTNANAGAGGAQGGAPNPEDEKDKAGAQAAGAPNAGASTADDDVDDEDEATLIRKLQKKGITVKSLADIKPTEQTPAAPTEEELRRQKEEKEAQIRSYGLKEKLVTSTELDEYAVDSTRPYAEVAYKQWVDDNYGDVSAEDRPSESDLADEFNEEFYQYAKEDDPKRTRKEKQLQALAQQYMKTRYGKVYDLDSKFNENLEIQQLQQSYKTTVDEALTELGDNFSFSVGEGKKAATYQFKLLPDDIKALKETFSNEDSFAVFGKSKMGKADLVNAIKSGFISKNLNKIISYIADTHARVKVMEAEKGLRGIPIVEDGGGAQQGFELPKNVHSKAVLEQNKALIS